MATRLKGLKISKVDFVDAGANQRANILLFKRGTAKGGESMPEKSIAKRFIAAIAKAVGMGEDEAGDALSAIAKDGARSFSEEMAPAAVLSKAGGDGRDKNKAAEDVEPDNPDADGNPQTTPKKGETTKTKKASKPEGVEDDMRIDKSLLTPEERKFLEDIEKKAGVAEEGTAAPAAEHPVTKGKDAPASSAGVPEAGQESVAKGQTGDMFEGLPAAVVDIIKNLQSRAEEAENRELLEVAKKYEILGTKADDLLPVLKGLKKSPEQYEKTVALLDAAVAATAGTFAEIGKKGSLENPNGSAWDRIEKKAAELRKNDAAMGYHEAIDKICSEHPELVAEYEQNR